MSRWAVVSGSSVANVIEASAEWVAEHGSELGDSVVPLDEDSRVGVGWRVARDGTMTPPETPPPTREQVVEQRNALLRASDWTQLADAPLTDEQRAAWATYRQALRDVPQQQGGEVAWPTPPGEESET